MRIREFVNIYQVECSSILLDFEFLKKVCYWMKFLAYVLYFCYGGSRCSKVRERAVQHSQCFLSLTFPAPKGIYHWPISTYEGKQAHTDALFPKLGVFPGTESCLRDARPWFSSLAAVGPLTSIPRDCSKLITYFDIISSPRNRTRVIGKLPPKFLPPGQAPLSFVGVFKHQRHVRITSVRVCPQRCFRELKRVRTIPWTFHQYSWT